MLGPESGPLDAPEQTAFGCGVGPFSLIVALLAGTAGTLSLTSPRPRCRCWRAG